MEPPASLSRSIFFQTYKFSRHATASSHLGLFFASGHGKGAVDGIGGTVKGSVWRRARSGAVINTALEFVTVAREACPQVHVEYVSKEEIDGEVLDLEDNWQNLETVPAIRSIRRIFPCSIFDKWGQRVQCE